MQFTAKQFVDVDCGDDCMSAEPTAHIGHVESIRIVLRGLIII